MNELEHVACMLAIEAPSRQGQASVSATVTWDTIHRLRAELDRRGINWRAGRKEYERLTREARAAAYAARQ
jgi:hypothetical protein